MQNLTRWCWKLWLVTSKSSITLKSSLLCSYLPRWAVPAILTLAKAARSSFLKNSSLTLAQNLSGNEFDLYNTKINVRNEVVYLPCSSWSNHLVWVIQAIWTTCRRRLIIFFLKIHPVTLKIVFGDVHNFYHTRIVAKSDTVYSPSPFAPFCSLKCPSNLDKLQSPIKCTSQPFLGRARNSLCSFKFQSLFTHCVSENCKMRILSFHLPHMFHLNKKLISINGHDLKKFLIILFTTSSFNIFFPSKLKTPITLSFIKT